MSTQKIIRVGNSLGITIPSRFIKSLSAKPGDSVKISLQSGDKLVLEFVDNHQLTLDLSKNPKSNS